MRNICIRSRLRIQLMQNGFKVIRFTNSQKKQTGKPVRDKEFIAYLADIPVVLNNNSFLFKNNVEYT